MTETEFTGRTYQGLTFSGTIQNEGLTKRELFAAMAMQGMNYKSVVWTIEYRERAEMAVKQADALIAALEAKDET